MHYYQFHIGDYKSHTHHLSPMEDLAFRRLLDFYYLHELPIKQREIARKIGLVEHEQEVLTVLDEFFVSTSDGYVLPRADEEITRYRRMSEKGKEGAVKRWHKGGDSPPIRDPNGIPIATNNHKPITNNQEPKKKTTAVAAPEGVSSELWDAFIGMRKAKKAPITALVLKGLQEEAGKAGWTMEAVLQEIVTRGWTSFKADWVAQKQASKESFYERETRAREEQFKRLTGRFDYDNPFTIDMETDNASE